MSFSLFSHNQEAYESALTMLGETGKAAIVHPTGTGKSFIGFKLCSNFSDARICWLSPSEYIFNTQIENWKNAGGEDLENIDFFTYARLMNLSDEEIDLLRPDYIVLDEFHRCGAEMWGAGVQKLLRAYPDVPVLGLSATAIRYLDNQRNMADELFDGNIASEISLGEAIVRGILNPPKYVLSIFSYQKDLEKYEKRVRRAKSKAVRDAGEEYLEALRRALDMAEGLDVIFEKHMTDRSGKYIVFCANFEHMGEMIDKVPEWFGKVDAEPHVYSAYSDDPETSKAFADFKADQSDHLKLLFCIDMLNEGVHVDDVSGVILLRPTVSPIIYKQQIGRALSANKKHDPIIFDIVLNIENLYSIGAIEEEMQVAMTYYRSLGLDHEIVNERFKVIDEVRNCIALFDRLNETLTASWDLMFRAAKQYYHENGDLDVPKRYVTEEGYSLGTWLNTQRLVRAGKQNGILTKEQIEKLDALGMRWDNVRDVSWEKYYVAAQEYFAEHGDLLVSVSDNKYHGVKLGRWISQIRIYYKNNIQCSFLTSERVEALERIGMVWDVPDYLWERNYSAALRYHQKYGNLDVPLKYVDSAGIRLGSWIQGLKSIRRGIVSRSAPLTDEQIEKLDALGMVWEKRKTVAWKKAYDAAFAYRKSNGNLDIPVAYVTEDGIALGRWIRYQKKEYQSERGLSPERKKLLDDIGMVWEREDPWMAKFELVKAYYQKNGNLNMKPDLIVNGVWLSRWLTEQIARFNEKKTGKSRSVKRLTPDQIRLLESVGVKRNQDRNLIAWQEQYEEAADYYKQHGNLEIPKEYCGKNGKYVGRWLIIQRSKYRSGELSKAQIDLLEKIGIVWSYDDQWEKAYERAKEYYLSFGNLLVTSDYVCQDGYKLGVWISNQRNIYVGHSQGRKLSIDKVKRLNDIRMVWNVEEYKWEQMYQCACDYYQQHGNLNVPRTYQSETGCVLREWLRNQRDARKSGKLSAERKRRLDQNPMDWLTPQERNWEDSYSAAEAFFRSYGNLLVPSTYRCPNGFMLGAWIKTQRKNRHQLSESQISKLNAISMSWEDVDLQVLRNA